MFGRPRPMRQGFRLETIRVFIGIIEYGGQMWYTKGGAVGQAQALSDMVASAGCIRGDDDGRHISRSQNPT